MTSESVRIVFCLGRDRTPLVRLYMSPTRDDGFSLGYAEEGFPNIHLTVFQKNGRIYSHIKDEPLTTHESEYPWSQYLSTDLLDDHLSRITMRWTMQMGGRTRCYVMKPSLVNKIRVISPTITDENELQIPMEFILSKIHLDFKNKRRWIPTTLGELARTSPYFGYITPRGRPVKTVFPMVDGKYLCYGQRQYARLRREQARLLGFEMYFDYLMLKHGELVSDISRKKLESGIIERAIKG